MKLTKAQANTSEINWVMMNFSLGCIQLLCKAHSLQKHTSNEVGENDGNWLIIVKQQTHILVNTSVLLQSSPGGLILSLS